MPRLATKQEKTEEILTFTEWQPHAPYEKAEPGQGRLGGGKGI